MSSEEKCLGYIVEFPPEEKDFSESPHNKKDNKSSLEKDDESQLIVGWNRALSLRKRKHGEGNCEDDNQNIYAYQKDKQRKILSGKFSYFSPPHYATMITECKALQVSSSNKVEEAGHTMPPPQP
ncbi:putative E3 ubiquitin-protein [Sesbania bispinosa]|nr:putative E3 ubiquitin-protein [Sesbania bispinosa]